MELQRLRTVFRTALELPEEAEVDGLEYRGIEKWDSLAHMSLVATIEDEFGVMLDTDEVIDLSSFDRARQILEKHGVVLAD
ncbi:MULTISPECIES: acyl carrier protein [Micromonospora]|uniref:Phosphopantetheine attachment site n=1 Tax=Micromonospora avicenniae TaxID=1198245 RepID=A0A1N6WWZ8_9ACTN|nr:phosphopantetheine-binding protein [Micromonospora avicenniae]SIQ94573.1 Phosphopantetheine attachment site [Micromonospora avicenniae]